MVSSYYFDKVLFLIFLVLVLIGSIFIYSALSANTMYSSHTSYVIKKEAFILAIGFTSMLIGYLIPIDFWKKYGYLFTIIALFLLILVLIFPAELKHKAVKRWLDLGFMKFQPSEFAKFALILFLATFLDRKKNDKNLSGLKKILIAYAVIGIFAFLIIIEPHKGASIFIFILGFLIVSSSYLPIRYSVIGLVLFIPVFVIFILKSQYALKRIEAFINPMNADTTQVLQSLLAFAKGGLFGEGIGAGTQKLKYLPEIHTDYIFALIGEELGFLGTSLVVVLFVLLLIKGISISINKDTVFTQTLGVGITFLIVLQALFHMLVNVGAFPPTGFTLPFISYGGSSLMINMLMAGILLRISKEPVKSAFLED